MGIHRAEKDKSDSRKPRSGLRGITIFLLGIALGVLLTNLIRGWLG